MTVLSSALSHLHALWGRWWPLPVGTFLAYSALMAAMGDLRVEHVLITLAVAVAAYGSARTKRFFIDMVPFLALAIGYDLVRYARAAMVRPENVIGCGLRQLELSLFAVAPGVTAQDYFAVHHTPALDLLFAVPYSVFLYFALGYAAYLFFADRPRMRFFVWAMTIGNYISFAMWLILPAAPPWYIRQHGCTIDVGVPANAAGLLRVDALLGTDYFAGFYSRASSVFGALPSMHCAYPLIGLLTAWKVAGWKTRPLHIVYVIWMFAAAVYLDHHWIVDAIAGWLVAVVSVLAASALLRVVRKRREARSTVRDAHAMLRPPTLPPQQQGAA